MGQTCLDFYREAAVGLLLKCILVLNTESLMSGALRNDAIKQ